MPKDSQESLPTSSGDVPKNEPIKRKPSLGCTTSLPLPQRSLSQGMY